MRRLVLRMVMTLDGVMSRVEHWLVRDEDVEGDLLADLEDPSCRLAGYGSSI